MKYTNSDHLIKNIQELTNMQLNLRLKETLLSKQNLEKHCEYLSKHIDILEVEVKKICDTSESEIKLLSNSLKTSENSIEDLEEEITEIFEEIEHREKNDICLFSYEELESHGQLTFSFV